MPSATRHLPNRRAVSLIELVMVVAILGIIAAVATPRFVSALSYYRAETAARRVRADLNYARRQAKTTGQPRTVTFSTAGNTYQLTGVPDPDHPAQEYSVDLTRAGSSASLVSADFDGEASVTFDAYGRPLAGSPPAPLATGTVVVAAAGRQRSVVVNATTGKASLP